jgi:hypothetical protein
MARTFPALQGMNLPLAALAAAAGIAGVSLLSSFYLVVDGTVERAALKRAAFNAPAAAHAACKPQGSRAARAACDPEMVLARLP